MSTSFCEELALRVVCTKGTGYFFTAHCLLACRRKLKESERFGRFGRGTAREKSVSVCPSAILRWGRFDTALGPLPFRQQPNEKPLCLARLFAGPTPDATPA